MLDGRTTVKEYRSICLQSSLNIFVKALADTNETESGLLIWFLVCEKDRERVVCVCISLSDQIILIIIIIKAGNHSRLRQQFQQTSFLPSVGDGTGSLDAR